MDVQHNLFTVCQIIGNHPFKGDKRGANRHTCPDLFGKQTKTNKSKAKPNQQNKNVKPQPLPFKGDKRGMNRHK